MAGFSVFNLFMYMNSNLRRIIREMIMSEAYEHTDDEIVTFDKIDLEYEFNKLNKLLFDGKLQIVPLKWSVSKGKHGFVSYTGSKATGRVDKINGLSMSKFFKIPYKMFKDTMAHEMIHVKNLQDDMRDGRPHRRQQAHGYEFLKEADRINSMGLGFKITVTGEGEFEVSDEIKGKDIYFAILTLDGGSRAGAHILTMTPQAFREGRVALEKLFNGLISRGKYRGVSLDYYQTNSSYFMQFPLQRKLTGGVSYSTTKDESEIEKAKSLGTFVDRVTLGQETANKEKEERQKALNGFYSQLSSEFEKVNTLTQVAPPSKSQEPIVPPKKEEPQHISDKMKEQNKQIMNMFKASNDKMQKEALFNLLKIKDDNRRDQAVNTYNMRFGKLGFIK